MTTLSQFVFYPAATATSANTPNKVVLRDGSGNFSAGTITAALSGNATTATTLATTRAINGTNFDGSGNITTANWGTSRTITIGGTGKTVDGSGNVTWATSELAAQTAVTLATARTINGTSFNGSANITTANWGTSRNISIGGTSKAVNGSGNVTWTEAEIAANTAVTLKTARNINGVSFNGSANITVADATKLPLAGGTLTGTLNTAYINGTSTSGIRTQRAATQDAIRLLGGSAGTGSFVVSLLPAALTASRTVTFPNGNVTLVAGTMVSTSGNQTIGGVKTFSSIPISSNTGLGRGFHNITISSSAPSGGSDGDVWMRY